MDIATWLVSSLDDTVQRMRAQVLDIVPLDRRQERFPDGNPIVWTAYHSARHAEVALRVLGAESAADRDGIPSAALEPGEGLQEVARPWVTDLDPVVVDRYTADVLDDVRRVLAGLTLDDLDRPVDVAAGIAAEGIDTEQWAWLVRTWGTTVADLVRWPLLAHITHHVGEMITVRNLMGLSPFR